MTNSKALSNLLQLLLPKPSNDNRKISTKKSKFDRFEERFLAILGFLLLFLYLYLLMTGQIHVWDHEMKVFLQSKVSIDHRLYSSISTAELEPKIDENSSTISRLEIAEKIDWESLLDEERTRLSKHEMEMKIQNLIVLIDRQHHLIESFSAKINENSSFSSSAAAASSAASSVDNTGKDPSSNTSKILAMLNSVYWNSILNHLQNRIDVFGQKKIDSAKTMLLEVAKLEAHLQSILDAMSLMKFPPEKTEAALSIKSQYQSLKNSIVSNVEPIESTVENHFKSLLSQISNFPEYKAKQSTSTSISPNQENVWLKVKNLFENFYSFYQNTEVK